ncbi:MAG: ribosome assembly cofactor RimP [Bacteroidota bacterium]
MLPEAVRKRITETIETHAPEAFVVDMQMHQGGRNVLSVKVDTDTGISLDTCARLNRKIGLALEDEPSMDFPYNLEVSSPGIGYPLKLHRQYVQNMGRYVAVKTMDDRQYEGKILAAEEAELTLEPLKTKGKGKKARKGMTLAADDPRVTPEKLLLIRFEEIEEAKVIIVF